MVSTPNCAKIQSLSQNDFYFFKKHLTLFILYKKSIDYINLSETPIEESIIVYIDSVVTEEWYYLVETNTVYLDFEPSEGALIEVGYVIYSD